MKAILALILVGLPAGAQAMGVHGGMGGYPHGGGAHGAIALYSLLAALGYWVLQHAGKQEPKCIKRTGAAVGTIIIIVSLLGLLCGVGSHIKAGMRACKSQCAGEMALGGGEERVVVVDGKREGAPMQINVKVTESKKVK